MGYFFGWNYTYIAFSPLNGKVAELALAADWKSADGGSNPSLTAHLKTEASRP